MHQLCPDGEDSWCFHQKAVTKGDDPQAPPSHDPIPFDVATELIEEDALTEESKLEGCGRNMQDVNETFFNQVVWKRCPKTIYVSRHTWVDHGTLFNLTEVP